MSGFIFGFNAILLNLGMGLIFAIWCIITGMNKIREDMGGAYSTTAIIINVVMIIGTIGYFAIVRPAHNTNATAPETIEYIDTTVRQ